MKLNAVERVLMNNPVRAAHQHRREAAWFRRLAGDELAGQHVLEVGCGRGVGAEVILDRLGAAEVTAFDSTSRWWNWQVSDSVGVRCRCR